MEMLDLIIFFIIGIFSSLIIYAGLTISQITIYILFRFKDATQFNTHKSIYKFNIILSLIASFINSTIITHLIVQKYSDFIFILPVIREWALNQSIVLLAHISTISIGIILLIITSIKIHKDIGLKIKQNTNN